jgi:glycine/serine hydroxymethyltransferase
MTMRGMKENEMKQVANWINEVSNIISDYNFIEDKEKRKQNLKQFMSFIENNNDLIKIKDNVSILCNNFPIYK